MYMQNHNIVKRDHMQEKVGITSIRITAKVKFIDVSDGSDLPNESILYLGEKRYSPQHNGSIGVAFHLVERIYVRFGQVAADGVIVVVNGTNRRTADIMWTARRFTTIFQRAIIAGQRYACFRLQGQTCCKATGKSFTYKETRKVKY